MRLAPPVLRPVPTPPAEPQVRAVRRWGRFHRPSLREAPRGLLRPGLGCSSRILVWRQDGAQGTGTTAHLPWSGGPTAPQPIHRFRVLYTPTLLPLSLSPKPVLWGEVQCGLGMGGRGPAPGAGVEPSQYLVYMHKEKRGARLVGSLEGSFRALGFGDGQDGAGCPQPTPSPVKGASQVSLSLPCLVRWGGTFLPSSFVGVGIGGLSRCGVAPAPTPPPITCYFELLLEH